MPTCQLVTCMDLHSNRGCSLRFSSNRGCLGFHLLNNSLLFAISMESLAEDLLKTCLFHWKWARVNLALHFLDNFVCLVWCIIWTLSATKIPSWIETTMKSNMDNQTQMRTIWVAECNSWSPQPMPFPSYWMLVDYVREHGSSTGEWKSDLDHEESKQLEIDNLYLFPQDNSSDPNGCTDASRTALCRWTKFTYFAKSIMLLFKREVTHFPECAQ